MSPYALRPRDCERCGATILRPRRIRGGLQRFCSQPCANSAEHSRGRQGGPAKYTPLAPVVCETCGGRKPPKHHPVCPDCDGEGLFYPDQMLRLKVEQVKAQRPPVLVPLEAYRRLTVDVERARGR